MQPATEGVIQQAQDRTSSQGVVGTLDSLGIKPIAHLDRENVVCGCGEHVAHITDHIKAADQGIDSVDAVSIK